MGNVHMEATQINYRGGSKKMSVEEAIKAAGTEITPEEKAWIDTIPELASQEIIAPEFDAEEGVYAVGDLVIYQGGLYQFTTAHETAGAWNPEEVAAVKISDELDALRSGLINVNSKVDGLNNIIIDRKNVVSGDKIPWVSFASGLIIWSAAGMASGSGVLFVGADNTAITYTSLSHGGNIDISTSDFDFANGELEFKRGFIQVIAVKLTNA